MRGRVRGRTRDRGQGRNRPAPACGVRRRSARPAERLDAANGDHRRRLGEPFEPFDRCEQEGPAGDDDLVSKERQIRDRSVTAGRASQVSGGLESPCVLGQPIDGGECDRVDGEPRRVNG
jgi:hypothetical protein